jgi:hypothetical protein
MNRYRCYFSMPDLLGKGPALNSRIEVVEDLPGVPGCERVGAFLAGFWMNIKMDLCTGADEDKEYFIPASAILMLERFDWPDPEPADQYTPEERAAIDPNAEPIEFNRVTRESASDPARCPHGRGWSDFCEPCGRVNGAII